MTFSTILHELEVILAEGAIAERLRRRDDIELHPTLFNTPLVYNEYGRKSGGRICWGLTGSIGVKILGGCSGTETDGRYLRYIADNL